MRNTGLEEAQAGIKNSGRNTNNLRYADDTNLLAESKEELKSPLMNVKEKSEKAGLKLNILPVPFFFLKIALAIRGFLYFHTNCEIICSSSVKNTVGSLIGIALNLQIVFGSILIFTILILPIHEHSIFLHLFVSCLISFTSVL